MRGLSWGEAARSAVRRVTWAQGVSVPPPPPCPPRWSTGPPDFVGIGVQKAGTSWWHALITAHPGVFAPSRLPKELHFFGRYWRTEFTPEDVAEYARFFPRPPGGISGEWTPRYLVDFWVLDLLKQAAPDAKLLVLLRDPVERFRSGVTHEKAQGARHPMVAVEALVRGYYADQLDQLRAHFPAEQILVLQYERCRRDPLPQLRRTYEFLGLDNVRFVPPNLGDEVNPSRAPKVNLPDQVRRQLVDCYQDDVRRLADHVPDLDLSLWPSFTHLTARR